MCVRARISLNKPSAWRMRRNFSPSNRGRRLHKSISQAPFAKMRAPLMLRSNPRYKSSAIFNAA